MQLLLGGDAAIGASGQQRDSCLYDHHRVLETPLRILPVPRVQIESREQEGVSAVVKPLEAVVTRPVLLLPPRLG